MNIFAKFRRGKISTSEPSSPESRIATEAEAKRIVAEAQAWAVQVREEAEEEVNARRAAVDAAISALDERDRGYRERKAVFDQRRFSYKKRQEEIEGRQTTLEEQRQQINSKLLEFSGLTVEAAKNTVLERLENELAAEHGQRLENEIAARTGDAVLAARQRIVEAMERQTRSHIDSAPRIAPLSIEGMDELRRERFLKAVTILGEETGAEVTVDGEKQQVLLRTQDPVGREVARQASMEILDRRLQEMEVPTMVGKTRSRLEKKLRELGERALWEMSMPGRPELADLVGTLHYRFSYGQNALLHCQEAGFLCGILATELGLSQGEARQAGMLHDIGKAVDHDVEGVHAIIGGELLRVLGESDPIIHAVSAHHFDVEPSTDLAMLTICADAISASRPGARRDTLSSYLARLEQLQTIATRHQGVERAFPLQAGREVRIFVKAKEVKDAEVVGLSQEIAREIESEMQYPGIIKVTVIREATATATAPQQIPIIKESASE